MRQEPVARIPDEGKSDDQPDEDHDQQRTAASKQFIAKLADQLASGLRSTFSPECNRTPVEICTNLPYALASIPISSTST